MEVHFCCATTYRYTMQLFKSIEIRHIVVALTLSQQVKI
jgi:hypothetical protein